MNTQGIQHTHAKLVEAVNMLPTIAQYPSLTPRELHLQVYSITSGNPILGKGNATSELGLKPQVPSRPAQT
eukprot:12899542-Prorocentrum_lima.AAC.1